MKYPCSVTNNLLIVEVHVFYVWKQGDAMCTNPLISRNMPVIEMLNEMYNKLYIPPKVFTFLYRS